MSTYELTFEEASKQMLLAMKALSECRVCCKMLSSPIVQCTYGHAVCSSCVSETMRCSVCGEKFVSFECIILSKLIDVIFQYFPKLYSFSCNCLSVGLEHEKFCEHRKIQCKICPWVGWANSVKYHVKFFHECFYLEDIKYPIDFTLTSDVLSESGAQSYFLMLKKANMFWLEVTSNHTDFARAFKIAQIPLNHPHREFVSVFTCGQRQNKFTRIANIPIHDDSKGFENKFSFTIPRDSTTFIEGEFITGFIEMVPAYE